MKKKTFDPFKNLVLDEYEQDIEDHIEEFEPIPNMEAEIKKHTMYAREYLKKQKRITVRVNQADLDTIKQKAIENNLPYQSLINTLLHHYASGKISIQL